jgi:hypothetical protein
MINPSWNYSHPELGIAKIPILTAQKWQRQTCCNHHSRAFRRDKLRKWRCNLDLDGKTGHNDARMQYIMMIITP